MTPKEKAEQISERLVKETTIWPFEGKSCAKIVCDEVLAVLAQTSEGDTAEVMYWKQVKQEIDNL
jgi:hypothetical protein